MIWLPAFVLLRLAVAAFFVLTAAYGVVSYSPFAFDMFIRPQLVPWITRFVAWHHAWFLAACAASVVTIWPDLDVRGSRRGAARIARFLAIGYVVVFAATAARLVWSPYLPSLWNDGRSLFVALIAFVPLVWLAIIDHLSAGPSWLALARTARSTMDAGRLLAACAAATVYFWAIHVVHAAAQGTSGGVGLWVVSGIWTLMLTAASASVLLTTATAVAAGAETTRNPRVAEYLLSVVGLAAGLAALLDRLVLPAISVSGAAAAAVSFVSAFALAVAWSGVAVRTAAAGHRTAPALELLLVPTSSRALAAVALAALPAVSMVALRGMERFDWDFLIQRLIVIAEAVAAFGLMLRLTDRIRRPAGVWTLGLVAAIPLVGLYALPRAALAVSARSGDRALEPTLWAERYAAAEVSFRLLSGVLVRWPGFDPEYYRLLQVNVSPEVSSTTPTVDFSRRSASGGASPDARMTESPRPDIFMFVVDSLRRDYLSPYNPAVGFTPRIDEFARDSFVFRNAFTRYGGTELAMPSIWVGGPVVRRVVGPGFERANALEKLLNRDGYRIAINDYTVSARLKQTTPVTTIDPGVPSADTDLCQNVASLESHLEASARDARPIFAYFAPMNVHLVNTRHAGRATSSDRDYPGFYSPYASRLRRIDGCFGDFIMYLRRRHRYDNAIVIITSDHGDSLGEDGNWGHAFWLFPEDVRVPLIMHVPPRLTASRTTDLARVAFSTDITPTLYGLLGHPVDDLGPLFGEPLFVAADRAPDSRRRESYLLTSSYAATYGLLRRNGRFLYVSDLFERKEFAFDLARGPLGGRAIIDHATRRVNQRLIRDRVEEVARLYRFSQQAASGPTAVTTDARRDNGTQ